MEYAISRGWFHKYFWMAHFENAMRHFEGIEKTGIEQAL